MNAFINRTEELAFLEKEYQRNGSSLVILYGRRRVGKTALANQFMKNKPTVYFLATEENELQNRIAFQNIVAEQTENELLLHANADSWDIIFKAWQNHDTDAKKLLILDEFQYLGKANRAFPSMFQKIWDTMLKDKPVMVILCGSLIFYDGTPDAFIHKPFIWPPYRTNQIKANSVSVLP